MPYGCSTTDRERWNLRGPVRACTLRRTWFACHDGGCGTDERGDTTHVEFRPDGALTLQRHLNHNGSAWESIREYDASERLAAVRHYGPNGLSNASIHEYDAHGRLERVVERLADGRERVATSYEYGLDGSHRKIDHLDSEQLAGRAVHWVIEDGSDVGYSAVGATRIVLQYSARSLPVEATFTDRDGQVLTRVNMTHDERGLVVEVTQTVLEVPLPEEVRAQLTPSDLEKFRAMLGGDGVAHRRVHRYDADGRRIETRSSQFGGLGQERQTFDYNERGDQVREVRESRECEGSLDDRGRLVENPASVTSHRSETRFQYDYDHEGNWIKKRVEGRSDSNEEFSVSTIETRDIQYYPAT